MQIPDMLQVRIMTKMMPEETLLNNAIEELVKYKEDLEKYKASETTDSNKDNLSLKDKLFGAANKEKAKKPSNDLVASKTMAILVKWVDEERSMEEIVVSSHALNDIMGKRSSNE